MKVPCDLWLTVNELADCGDCPDASQTQLVDAVTIASEVLYLLSGQQFPGTSCVDTVRPCRLTAGCGCDPLGCGCPAGSTVALPRSPVIAVDSVLVDGAVFTDFRLDAPNLLVRLDDERWPCCQDMTAPTTETNTWQVAYTFGQAVPEGGVAAARALAVEVAKACVGQKCALPPGAIQVTQRGVTYQLAAFDGRTGLTVPDLWLGAINPKKRRKAATIVTPDDAVFRRAAPIGS